MLKPLKTSCIRLSISILLTLNAMFCGASESYPGLQANDWPWWRGYQRDGSAAGTASPHIWDETNNVVWKYPTLGIGHSSPIVINTRLFFTTADEQRQTQELTCLDIATGKLLWHKVVNRGGFVRKHASNSHASATPASDGQKVFTVFLNNDRLQVSAYDLQGDLVWEYSISPYGLAPSHEGYGSSPALFDNYLIVNADNRAKGKLVALDRNSGKIAWSVDRRNLGSFSTPTVNRSSNRWQVILSGTGWIDSYDPLTGKLLWNCQGTAEATANTVAVSDKFALASGGAPERDMVCVRTDGLGDVSRSHVVWRTNRAITYVPSPLHYAARFYVLTDNGILQCLEEGTGREVWSQRLAGSFKASLIRQGNILYATSEQGRTYVIDAADTYKQIAVNELREGSVATPVIVGENLYLRTTKTIYRFTSLPKLP